jgi:drug/metabolite transporter (DMT)-like permease
MRSRLRGAIRSPAPLAGLGMVGAYALTLAALQKAPAPAVSAVRESSVVIGVALAAVFLSEPVGRRRLAGSLAVVSGVALIALA